MINLENGTKWGLFSLRTNPVLFGDGGIVLHGDGRGLRISHHADNFHLQFRISEDSVRPTSLIRPALTTLPPMTR